MATHPIGPGKTIVGVPMDLEDSRELGRIAFKRDVSKAEFMRRLLKEYLAGKIVLPCIAALGLVSVLRSSIDPFSASPRRVRTVRGARVVSMEGAWDADPYDLDDFFSTFENQKRPC